MQPGQESIPLDFNPRRAAIVAASLSSAVILIAIGFVVQTTLSISTTGQDLVLLQVTIAVLVTVLCSGVVVNYVRSQPPDSTKLWNHLRSVIAFLLVKWLLLFSLAFVVGTNVLYPEMSCFDNVGPECDGTISSLAFNTLLAISLAVVCSLVVHSTLSFDLHRNLPVVRAILERDEGDRNTGECRQVLIVQAAFVPLAKAGAGEESFVGYGASRRNEKPSVLAHRSWPTTLTYIEQQSLPARDTEGRYFSTGKARHGRWHSQHHSKHSEHPKHTKHAGKYGDHPGSRRRRHSHGDMSDEKAKAHKHRREEKAKAASSVLGETATNNTALAAVSTA